MQQIADLLEKLGMSEYADHLAENEIDSRISRSDCRRQFAASGSLMRSQAFPEGR